MTTELKSSSISSESPPLPTNILTGAYETTASVRFETLTLKDLLTNVNCQFRKTTKDLRPDSGSPPEKLNSNEDGDMAGSNNSSTNACQEDQNENGGQMKIATNHQNSHNSTMEMMQAIEELRRENERIVNELGATQDLLDLFEQYRELIHKHMDVCMCAGKDHLLSQWKQYERDYQRLLPIKRLEPQLSFGDKKSHLKRVCQAVALNGNARNVVKSADGINGGLQEKNEVTLKMVNGTLQCKRNKKPANRDDIGNKSLVRSFLDKIKPVGFEDFNGTSTREPSPPVSFIKQGSNVLIRKRSLSSSNENRSEAFLIAKKIRHELIQVKNKKSAVKGESSGADHEVERLDKLNNALDQILMGRFDALSQLETFSVDNNNNANNHQEEESSDDDDHEEEEEEDDGDEFRNNSGQNMLRKSLFQNSQSPISDDDDDDDDDDSEDDEDEINGFYPRGDEGDDIIFMDGHGNRSTSMAERTLNFSSNQSNKNGGSVATSNILSAVLQSGLKPYSNYPPSVRQNDSTRTTNATNSNSNRLTQTPKTVLPQIVPPPPASSPANLVIKTGPTITVQPTMAGLPKRPHLTNEERLDIINRLKRNESGARIARDYGITKQAVSAIKRRAQLMGDDFSPKYFPADSKNCPTPWAFGDSASRSLPNTNNRNVKKISAATGPSNELTINLAAAAAAISASLDNSLVSRQLKQQRMNASIIKQSNLLAQLPRSTSDLVMPVDPVAIIKSQMALKNKNGTQTKSVTPKSLSSSNVSAKIDTKRLILPQLLQGTESYTPNYVTSNAKQNSTSQEKKSNTAKELNPDEEKNDDDSDEPLEQLNQFDKSQDGDEDEEDDQHHTPRSSSFDDERKVEPEEVANDQDNEFQDMQVDGEESNDEPPPETKSPNEHEDGNSVSQESDVYYEDEEEDESNIQQPVVKPPASVSFHGESSLGEENSIQSVQFS